MPIKSNLVVFFHPLFSDGGVERTNIYLGKGLIERGYQVEFLTTQATDHFSREVHETGIRMVELGKRRTLFSIAGIVKYLVETSKLKKKVYFVSCQYYANIISMLVSILLKFHIKNICFINSERNHYQEFFVKGGLKNRLIYLLVRYLYRFADCIIANSMETANDLSKVIKRRVYCVYNPTINERIDELRKEQLEERWFICDPRPCVIGIGRLTLQKDFKTLIQAFKMVREHIDAKLVILGDGDQRLHLQRQIIKLGMENDVYLPGFVDNPYKFLASSNVFVLSSRYEGLPNVLIEAVYLKIPCVSTRCKSGPREILLDGKGGYLVPIANDQKMADAIVSILSDMSESRSRTEIAFEGINRFRYEKIVNSFVEVITQ